PHRAVVELRLVAEADRGVPGFEFLAALKEADDLAVLGVRRHAVPGPWREDRRATLDDRMNPLGHGAIRFPHFGDLGEYLAFALPRVRALAASRLMFQLLGPLLHGSAFVVRKSPF